MTPDKEEDPIKPLNIAFIGSFPPRKCGIGTFTRDLSSSVQTLSEEAIDYSIIAVDNKSDKLDYPEEVEFRIQQQKKKDYLRAAEFINMSNIDIVCIQHEYGIYGGKYGEYIITALKNISKPVVTTFHTVLENPPEGMGPRTQQIIDLSESIIVLSKKAKEFLIKLYRVDPKKIKVIHHGVPDVPFIDPNYYKDKFNVEGRTVLLTFGLLSPNKSVEVVLKALPEVVKQHPEVVYIVLGVTHPDVKRQFGEEYRMKLKRLVRNLKLQDNVVFVNRYTKLKELTEFIGASDIYLTPYGSREQISSGTLAYAVGAGKAVVSTPYFYAEELLADERGVLFDFSDHEQLRNRLLELLDDETKRNRIRKNAYLFGREMVWKQVAQQYYDLFQDVRLAYVGDSYKKLISRKDITGTLPEISLKHLQTLTDECGLTQHSWFAIPDRKHGYSSDDAGRALPFILKYYEDTHDRKALDMAKRYLAFLYHAQREEDGYFHNFMDYGRTFLDEVGSEDTQGRVIWGLGYAIYSEASPSVTNLANHMFDNIMEHLELSYPQAKAYTINGLYYFLQRFEGAESARRLMEEYADDLLELYNKNKEDGWKWIGDKITYGSAKIPHALLMSYDILEKEEYKTAALEILEFLTTVSFSNDMFEPVGSDGWYPKGEDKAKFIQQPIEAWYFLEAYAHAMRLTQDASYAQKMQVCFDWFLGNNTLEAQMGNTVSGSCLDGIRSDGVNPNRGAESTLAFLHAIQIMSEFF
ncbi:MAG: glycosyltransferase [Nanoarchaeota archaeon]